MGASAANLVEQFPSGDADELLAANFTQDYAAGAALKLGKNSFEKVGHEAQSLNAAAT
jgi:hypothetical protein